MISLPLWWVWTGKKGLTNIICIQLEGWMNLKWKTRILILWLICEINGNTLGFCLVLSRHFHNPVKQVIWNYYFFHFESIKFRSSRSQMSFKIEVFKIFAIFTGKYMCWSLFMIKFISLQIYQEETPIQVFPH